MHPGSAAAWKITMMLADSAQAVQGKLYILGGGWSVTGPGPTPFAVALKIDVPWDEANRPHSMSLELLNSDGKPVLLPGPQGPQPMKIEGRVEVGRPPGLTPGVPLDAIFAVGFGPMPLPAGRYEWRCTLPEANASATCAFTVRGGPAPHVTLSGLPPPPQG